MGMMGPFGGGLFFILGDVGVWRKKGRGGWDWVGGWGVRHPPLGRRMEFGRWRNGKIFRVAWLREMDVGRVRGNKAGTRAFMEELGS